MKKIAKFLTALALGVTLAFTPVSAASASEINQEYSTEATEGYDESTNEITGKASNEGADETIAESTESESAPSSESDEETTYKEGTTNAESDENSTPNNSTTGTENDANSGTTEGAKNSLTEVYEILLGHLTEILSLAAFVGSMICAVIYKSGLLPMVENRLRSIKNATQKIKETTDKAELDNRESFGNITGRITELEATIKSLTDSFATLTERLNTAEAEKTHREKTDALLLGELDMLYDIFMSSALPEYEKQRVGERVARLKGDLTADEYK